MWSEQADALQEAWRSLGGLDEPALELRGAPRHFGSPYALDEIASAAIGSALLAAAELAEARCGTRPPVSLERSDAAFAFASERLLESERPLAPAFAPLSRFAATADGHIRLHANYPHHRAALLAALGNPRDDAAALSAIAARGGTELEQEIVAAGGAAAAVRSEADWHTHPAGRAVARPALLDLRLGDRAAPPLPEPGPLPCSGVRVLDLTRVIAGPVGTRMLAALGAEVLRVDPPQMPELELSVLDGMVGKRSTLLDLRSTRDRAAFERLLEGADVLVQGYRPGALAAFGLDSATLARRQPHLTTVTLSAWGAGGPWAERRGFDSLVQAACGIALACAENGVPGALPVQALDHATGYLVAAAAMRGLHRRARDGRAAHAELALTRTAMWLMRRPALADRPTSAAARPSLVEVAAPGGGLRCVAPPGSIGGRRLTWRAGVPAVGADPPRWRAHSS